MFAPGDDTSPPSKCYVTRGLLPKFIDPKQPPSKRKPFSSILNQPFNHTVELVLSEDLYNHIWGEIAAKLQDVHYSKAVLSLSDLLEECFFNLYIKTGNILMLSDGRPGIDNLYFLKDGVLRLELPKELYERAGLAGKPIQDGGRKHLKMRYAVEINLRQPFMLHGKKGFERIVWAFKNVLNHAVTWLFFDFGEKAEALKDGGVPSAVSGQIGKETGLPTSIDCSSVLPITKHHPQFMTCIPDKKFLRSLLAPSMKILPEDALSLSMELAEETLELKEWLDLISLDSPRVRGDDVVDPFLCRYTIPDGDQAAMTQVVRINWKGYLPSMWVRQLLLECIWAMRKRPEQWFALSSYTFQTEAVDRLTGCTILQLPRKAPPETTGASGKQTDVQSEYLLWETTSGSS